MKKPTRDQRVLAFLEEHGKINYMDALYKCGTSRLAPAIFNLRKKHLIKTNKVDHRNQFGEKEKVAEYILII
tara:strand:+ start:5185 stop:5400 length:216 start_codon:yes stop_codon:yes gene_type:complete